MGNQNWGGIDAFKAPASLDGSLSVDLRLKATGLGILISSCWARKDVSFIERPVYLFCDGV